MSGLPVRRIALAAGVAAACGTLALLPATAPDSSAAPAPHARSAHSAIKFAPARIGGTAKARVVAKTGYNINGYNWSGAAATGSGFSSVSANWAEPYVTCNSTNDLMAPWVGIDGYGSSSVEQTGVATDCSSGSPVYQAWYEMYPDAPVYYGDHVAPGDQISASVSRSGTSYTLTLSDNSQGWTQTTTQSLGASNASAEVIMESPTGAYPNFGSVNFSGASIDGSPLGDNSPTLMTPATTTAMKTARQP